MTTSIDFDVGNYTVYEILDMFKLDSASCTAREAEAEAPQVAASVAPVEAHQESET